VLVIALLANFLQSRQHGFLYAFTFAALAASFTRPAGNLLFPVLLVVGYVTVRGRIVHYIACMLIFAAAVALYQWHRYEIFDMRNQASIPSYTGQQIFYNLYINSGDFGIRLSPPDIGPNLVHVTEILRQRLQPSIRESEYMKSVFAELPAAFSEKNLLPYTPDELIERIYSAPNYEYYLLLASADPNDQRYLLTSWEIVRAHPLYAIRFAWRNLRLFLFDPGYAHTRHNTAGFHRIGLQFMPLAGYVLGEDAIAARAAREIKYVPLPEQPPGVQVAMRDLKLFWETHFHEFVYYTSILMVVAWIGVLLRLPCLALRTVSVCKAFASPAVNGIIASVIAVSIFLLYNTLIPALFAEPDFRYFHFTELIRIMISGLAISLVLHMIAAPETATGALWRSSRAHRLATTGISKLRDHDFLDLYFGSRPLQWTMMLAALTAGLFAWWSISIINRTW
jgi:hypothetical protein